MGRDFQFIQQRLVIQAVGGKAVQVDFTLRREPNFIGEARQVVLPLGVAAADGIYRFTAVAELAKRFTDVLHRRLIAADEVFQIQYDTGDITVVFRLANRLYDIEQRVLLQTIGTGAEQLAADDPELAAGGRLINDHAGDVHQQRAACGMFRGAAAKLCPDADANQH